MRSTREFAHDPRSVRAARQFALEGLAGQSADQREVVELLVSELATNCVRHTDSGFTVSVETDATGIRVAVTDRGAGQPVVQSPGPRSLSGRGLAMVEMLSDAWGVAPGATAGKTVWFHLPGDGAGA